MKVLLVGSNFNYAIERYYVKYLKEFGVEILHYPSADIVYKYHSKNLVNKILFHSKIKTGYKSVNKELLELAGSFNPDVIWVFKGMEIFPKTLMELKSRFRLANYNPDHPFLITSRGSGNKNVRDSVGMYHLHFCYHNELMQRIRREFNVECVFLPFAYDTSDIVYLAPHQIKETNRVCFQGNPDAFRVEKIELLAYAGLEVDVYGLGWQKTRLKQNPRVRVFEIASRPDFWKMNQEYRVQLNLFRAYNNGSHNMRTFEIPAVGGIQLTPYSEEQSHFFESNKEVFFFNDDDEMVEKVSKLLALPTCEAAVIRKAARERSLVSGYTFKDRARTVFDTFNQMKTW